MRMMWMAAALIAAATAGAAAEPDPAPVEVMVVGSWHFAGSPGDMFNVETDDVRQPRRQAELEALAAALAEFRPTKIMVEQVSPDLVDRGYAAFTPAMLAANPNEVVQIAYRLAHRLGHQRVYAIDVQGRGGQPDYFPFGRLIEYDARKGQGDLPRRMQAFGEAMTRDFAERQARMSIPALLLHMNAADPAEWVGLHYELLAIGDSEEQPGAELNAMIYMRNAKIFAKLMSLAEPGDRIFVVYGDSHSYWLRHFARETRGFENVDPAPYLRAAAGLEAPSR